ncbi:MAG TPA: hypothetical protein VJ227_02150 [Patescibacteria group bacterium]|nr:hypothetical protein [Patescibacteria group bacterium]
MKKYWEIFLLLVLAAVIFILPAIFGGVVANAGMACEPTPAWLEWLELCIFGSYVMLTLNGLGIIAVIAIVAIIVRIIYLLRH